MCISAFDLNVILGNLTENAIEAAEQTKDKWMSVDIYYEKGMLSMEIKNSFQHELAVEKNKLLSTKEEKGHGIGLANVRKMVEKYQGFMDVSNTNQIFTEDALALVSDFIAAFEMSAIAGATAEQQKKIEKKEEKKD